MLLLAGNSLPLHADVARVQFLMCLNLVVSSDLLSVHIR